MAKRAIDVLVGLVGLVLTAPLMLLIALAIRLDSVGRAIYVQRRVGRAGRLFRVYKFRTMVADADRRGPLLTGREDPRITRLGRILRPTRLDELPQFWNVLRGDMSLVGPRPELPSIVDTYTAEQRGVLTVRPGLTGPTQLSWLDEGQRYPEGVDREAYYRDHILPVKVESDLRYVRTRTGLGDLVHLVGLPFVIAGVVLRRAGRTSGSGASVGTRSSPPAAPEGGDRPTWTGSICTPTCGCPPTIGLDSRHHIVYPSAAKKSNPSPASVF